MPEPQNIDEITEKYMTNTLPQEGDIVVILRSEGDINVASFIKEMPEDIMDRVVIQHNMLVALGFAKFIDENPESDFFLKVISGHKQQNH